MILVDELGHALLFREHWQTTKTAYFSYTVSRTIAEPFTSIITLEPIATVQEGWKMTSKKLGF